MRIRLQASLRISDPNVAQKPHCNALGVLFRAVASDRLHELCAHGKHRVEARARVLKNDRHLGPAKARPLAFGKRVQIHEHVVALAPTHAPANRRMIGAMKQVQD